MIRIKTALYFILFIFITWPTPATSQSLWSKKDQTIENLGPSSWWCNTTYHTPLIILHGNNISSFRPVFNYNGVALGTIYPTSNPNYLIFEITISPEAQPGRFSFVLPGYNQGRTTVPFELLPDPVPVARGELNGSDAIYQIVPDRFCNGNIKNDHSDGLFERSDRTNPSGVHGGDLAGIVKHLDYIQQMGFTTLELTPVYHSNQYILSYERMAPTHFFKIDPRLGSLNEYQALIAEAHHLNLKVIQSLLLNQIGAQHPLVKDPPDKDWSIPLSKEFTIEQNPYIYTDPHAAAVDRQKYLSTLETMDAPLLNQSNPLVRKHLTQQLIWWIKSSDVDGIRIENTHQNQPVFLAETLSTLRQEFPKLNIIGAPVTATPANNYFWLHAGYANPFTHLTDAPLYQGVQEAFTAYQQFDEALRPLYTTGATDFLYPDATQQLIVYADQHNLSRAFTLSEKDPAIFRMMMGFIFTFRGIPSLLYGSEIMLPGLIGEGPGFVRAPLPGGWSNDKTSVFQPQTLSADRQESLAFITQLLNWRKSNPELMNAALIHFEPHNGLYIYTRETNDKALLVIINNQRIDQQRVLLSDLAPNLKEKFSKGKDVISGTLSHDLERLIVGPKSILILELQP